MASLKIQRIRLVQIVRPDLDGGKLGVLLIIRVVGPVFCRIALTCVKFQMFHKQAALKSSTVPEYFGTHCLLSPIANISSVARGVR